MSWVRAISTSSSATCSAAWVTSRYPRSCFNYCECPAASAPDDDDAAGEAAEGGPRGECCQRRRYALLLQAALGQPLPSGLVTGGTLLGLHGKDGE